MLALSARLKVTITWRTPRARKLDAKGYASLHIDATQSDPKSKDNGAKRRSKIDAGLAGYLKPSHMC